MESGDGETVRILLYKRAVEDGPLVAVAELDPVAPPRPLEGRAASPVNAEPHPGSGLYLGFVQGRVVLDLAFLCFSGGRPVGDYEVLDMSSTEEDEEEEDDDEEEDDEEEDDEDLLEEDDDDEEEDEEEEDDEDLLEEEDDEDLLEDDEDLLEEEEQADVQKQALQIKLRTWLSRRRVVVKVYRGKRWVFTKEYFMAWLEHTEMEQVSSQNSFKMGSGTSSASTYRNLDIVMDFEVTAIVSPIFDELKPSMDDFKIIKKLYAEGDCRVFKCIFLGCECTVKANEQKVPCSTEPREIEIISNLKDKRVMTFYQAWVQPWSYKQRPEEEWTFMHLEFCPKTLKHALKFKEIKNHGWFIFEEIVKGVKFLHGESVVHRDLKPDNIFFGSDWGIRIGDFGDACIGKDEFGLCGGTPNCGTKYYLAPELDSGEKITEKVDIYSIGVIFFELFSWLNTGHERYTTFSTLRDKGVPEDWKGDSEFVNKLIALEPSNRPSPADILEHVEQQRQVDTSSSAADFLEYMEQQVQIDASDRDT